MERAVAITKLKKLLGESFRFRVDSTAPSAEERQDAKDQLANAVAIRNSIKDMRDVRYRSILTADKEYQQLKASFDAAQERVEELSSKTRHFKFTVGTLDGPFFRVEAQGDSWEDVIDKLKK